MNKETEKHNEKAKLIRFKELEDAKFIMSTAKGRRYIWRLLEKFNIFRQCFTGNSKTFFNEGMREAGLFIYIDIMESCPELFIQAQKENFKTNEEN